MSLKNIYIFDADSPSNWMAIGGVPTLSFTPVSNCFPWGKGLVSTTWELEGPCYANKGLAS